MKACLFSSPSCHQCAALMISVAFPDAMTTTCCMLVQEQSRSNPGALLAQLKVAQESPRQQMALMRMLRESLHLPAEAAPRQPSPDQPPARVRALPC